MTKYELVSKFNGYRNKTDITNLPPGVLVVGSQNVLMNDGERVAVRKGFELDGDSNTANTPVLSSYDWNDRHNGINQNLKSYYDVLAYRYVDSSGNVTWNTLEDGWGDNVNFNYTEFWDTTEEMDVLLMVNGSDNIYEWSGAVTTYASSTVNTITKQGTESWAEIGAFTAGTRSVTINGIDYTYTGGESTTTLTGVAPNPTLGGHSVGDVIVQTLRTYSNGAATGLGLSENDLIATLNNQVYVGSLSNRQVYVSQQNSFTNYSFSSPRTPGEGALFTLDSCPVGFVPQEDSMYMTAGKSMWYKTDINLSADQAAETLTVSRLKTTEQSAAQSQALISKIKNYVFFVTQEPTLDTLGKLELINNPQSVNISDPIKLDFDSYDFTGGQCFYDRNFIYITLPVEGLVRMFNLATGFWEAPQILPISRFAIIDGSLYGHSSQTPETYQMNVGYNDNGNPINAIARFSYQQFGDRANNKRFNQFYNEGYISSNTELTCKLRFDYLGTSGTTTTIISGSDSRAVPNTNTDGSLGKQSFGTRSLAGRSETDSDTLPPKYRVIKTFPYTDFYEYQVEYSSDDVDQHWELLAWGPAATDSPTTNANITE